MTIALTNNAVDLVLALLIVVAIVVVSLIGGLAGYGEDDQ